MILFWKADVARLSGLVGGECQRRTEGLTLEVASNRSPGLSQRRARSSPFSA